MTVELIGVPLNYGCGKTNVSMGTKLLRKEEAFLPFSKGDFADRGDIPVEPLQSTDVADGKLNYLNPILHTNKALAQKVAQVIDQGHKPLIVGGDHSIALGSLAGLLQDGVPTAVIWIDAHTDINTAASTMTGNIHGMPLAAAMGIGREAFQDIYDHDYTVDPKNVYFVGPRDVDPFERELVEKEGIRLYDSQEVFQKQIEVIAEEIICHIDEAAIPRVHISLDIDSMDPAFAPAVSTPVNGGMTEDQVHTLLRILLSRLPVWSMDVVEYHPEADEEDMTLGMMKRLMDVIAEEWSDISAKRETQPSLPMQAAV